MYVAFIADKGKVDEAGRRFDDALVVAIQQGLPAATRSGGQSIVIVLSHLPETLPRVLQLRR